MKNQEEKIDLDGIIPLETVEEWKQWESALKLRPEIKEAFVRVT